MHTIVRLVGLVGVVDSVWLALDRARWSRFWARTVRVIGEGGVVVPVLAVTELAFSLYLLTRGWCGRRSVRRVFR